MSGVDCPAVSSNCVSARRHIWEQLEITFWCEPAWAIIVYIVASVEDNGLWIEERRNNAGWKGEKTSEPVNNGDWFDASACWHAWWQMAWHLAPCGLIFILNDLVSAFPNGQRIILINTITIKKWEFVFLKGGWVFSGITQKRPFKAVEAYEGISCVCWST